MNIISLANKSRFYFLQKQEEILKKIWGRGVGNWELGIGNLGIWELGIETSASIVKVQGSEFRVQSSGFWVQSSEF